ncbi:MAG: hypothetical protein ACI8RZ_005109, partial [Myxococcota bacterium]
MRLLLLSLLLGCDSKDDDDATSVSDTADEGTTTLDTGSTLDDTGASEDIAWWQLSGQLIITKGSPDLKKSTLQVTLLTEALKPICVESLLLSSLLDATTLPHPDIYAWWLISLGEGDGGCGGKDIQDTPFYLGV